MLENVSVTYTDSKHYTTTVSSDISIGMPEFSYVVSNYSVSNLPSFAIIAKNTLKEGNTVTSHTVSGSAYAGSILAEKSMATGYRLSGNDITQSKLDELTNFARSGFPIIISNDLLNAGTDAAPAYNMSVSLTGTYSGGYLTLTATVNTDATGDFIYQWYKDGQKLSEYTATSSKTATYKITSVSAGSYQCKVTLKGKTADSNTVTLSKKYSVTLYDQDESPLSLYYVSVAVTNNSNFTASTPFITGQATYT